MLKNLRFHLLGFLLSGWLALPACGNHIVGGELQMKATGQAGQFQITLIQFWDQNNLIIPRDGVPGNRDPQATLYIYQKRNNSYKTAVTLDYMQTEQLTYQNKACASSRALQTSIGNYQGIINLDAQDYSDPEGYYIVWERCCRNDDINNIVDPGDNGMVFYLEFPAINVTNSSPEFVAPNGQYICANRQFTMNMSATDADGDDLRYSLVTPMRGTTTPTQTNGNQSPKSAYPLVDWSAGIGLSNVIPGSSPLKVSLSGVLTVNANRLGLYVFTVQCEEFRNGKRIGLVRRDFQLLVIDCNDDQPEPPVIRQDGQEISQVAFCPGAPVELTTENSPDCSYQWQLNGLNISGANGPSMMVQESGNYTVIKSYTNKCSRDTASSIVQAVFTEPELAKISASKLMLCENDSVMLLANDGNLSGQQKATWRNGSTPLEAKTASLSVAEPGVYFLEIDDEIPGCIGKDSIEIGREDLSVSLPEKKTIVEGGRDSVTPMVSTNAQPGIFAWSPPDGLVSAADEMTATISPVRAEQYYQLRVTSPAGCVATDSILIVTIKPMYIPAAFSPNGDGQNDTFEIFNADAQIEQMRIYNRWGELIYHSKGYAQPWNGTYRNLPVPAGSYPYKISISGREINGTVLILR